MLDSSLIARIHARLAHELRRPDGAYTPLIVEDRAVGWLDAVRTHRLLGFDDVFHPEHDSLVFSPSLADAKHRTEALDAVTRALARERLLTPWRDEIYAVRADDGGDVLFHIERAAARYFGIATYAAHMNGIVASPGSPSLWFARRSPDKAIEPDRLDNLVGGGIHAGSRVDETMQREAWEESGMDGSIACAATCVGAVRLCRARPDGLQREVIMVHDLVLPHDFMPRGIDGEAVEHRLEPIARAAELIANDRGRDIVTADASLVVMDYLLRSGFIPPDDPHFLSLIGLRWPAFTPDRARPPASPALRPAV